MEEHRELDFDSRKRYFFTRLGLRAREWLKTHKKLGGLWEGKKQERWENVSEHCLVEAVRADELADLLKLSPETKSELFAAAVVHDFNKKEEITETAQQGRTPESFDRAYKQARQKLSVAGVPQNIIEIADSVGHASTRQMEDILRKNVLDDHDVARLVMHYIDDYTLGTEWVAKAEVGLQGQALVNDLDRRMDANENNPKYSKIAEQGFYKEQRRVGYMVEQKLVELIRQRSGEPINSKLLPEYIDKKIKGKIQHEI